MEGENYAIFQCVKTGDPIYETEVWNKLICFSLPSGRTSSWSAHKRDSLCAMQLCLANHLSMDRHSHPPGIPFRWLSAPQSGKQRIPHFPVSKGTKTLYKGCITCHFTIIWQDKWRKEWSHLALAAMKDTFTAGELSWYSFFAIATLAKQFIMDGVRSK